MNINYSSSGRLKTDADNDLNVDCRVGSPDDAAPAGVAGGVGDGGLGGRRDVGHGRDVHRVASLRLVDDGADVDLVRGVRVWRGRGGERA